VEPLGPDDPTRVGDYVLLGRLGAGGMGEVFLGRSPGGRPVAVKLVRPQFGADPQFRRRFAAEVEAARRVGGFYTAHVVDAEPYSDRPWLVTAYVPGPSLLAAVSEHGPLPREAVAVLGAGLAEGLTAIHGCGLIHRDLKPSNVILAADGPRVIDFGIVRATEITSVTASGVIAGTPAYMSPEQARGDREIGPASDVFSLGSVLAFAATGRSPFGEGTAMAVLYRVVQEEPDLTDVPDELRGLIATCLAKDPADRPGLAEVLDRLANRGAVAGVWPPPAVTAMSSGVDQGDLTPPGPATVVPPTTAAVSGGRPGRAWALGGGLVFAAIVLVVVLVAVFVPLLGNSRIDDPPPASVSQAAAPTSAVIGRIIDAQAGLSYARLGPPWADVGAEWTQPGWFTSGQVSAVQAPINGASFNATSLAGLPRDAEMGGYRGPSALPEVASRVRQRILGELFTVPHTSAMLSSGAHQVPGATGAWLEKFRLDIPQAEANGWTVTSDTLALLFVDRGGTVSLLFVSVPDAFTNQGDLDQVLASARIP
jgi:serine/threonine protein kinase